MSSKHLGPGINDHCLRAHLSKLESLRTAAPSVPLEVIRQFPTWFPGAEDEFPLDPSFEDTRPEADPDHVATFKKLQRCRDAKLVEAVNADFMFFAAINSTACILTPLGRHYWRLVQSGRI
jgi:hypothetical protein